MLGNVPTVVYRVDSDGDTLRVIGMTKDGVHFQPPPMPAVNILQRSTGRGVVYDGQEKFAGPLEADEPYRPQDCRFDVQFMQVYPDGRRSEGSHVTFREKRSGIRPGNFGAV